MTDRPKVTIGIPVYNGAGTIERTIQSVLDQTFADFELLIIDNASTDDTLSRIAKFSDRRIRLINNPENLGAEANWNMVLHEAKGDLITLLPADDTLYPTSLEIRHSILNDPDNKSVVFVFSARQVIDEEDRSIMLAKFFKTGRISCKRLIIAFVLKGMNPVGEPGAVLFRRSTMEKTGGFDISLPYIIDGAYWIRLLDHGDAYAIAEPLCTFRITRTNWSANLKRKRLLNYLEFIDQIRSNHPRIISPMHVFAGKIRCLLNELLRRIVYRLNNRKRSYFR